MVYTISTLLHDVHMRACDSVDVIRAVLVSWGRGHEGQAAQRQTLLMVRGATLLSVRGKSPHNKSVVVLRAKSGGLKTVYTYSLLRAFVRYWKKP